MGGSQRILTLRWGREGLPRHWSENAIAGHQRMGQAGLGDSEITGGWASGWGGNGGGGTEPWGWFVNDYRWQSEYRFCGSVCPSLSPSLISTVSHKFPLVIKFHGALPDGIFSHFPGPPAAVRNTGQVLLPQTYTKEFN